MATYTWNGSVDQALNTGNNWTGPWPGTTGSTDVFVFSGTPTRAPATTTGFSVPAMRVASSYTLGAITLTMTGNLSLNGQNTVDGTHSVYIEDGEIFWANSPTQIVVGGTNNVPVYVGNNAEFRLGSYLGNNTNRIIKYGPGKLYFVYGTTPASVGNIGKGLTINEGSFVLRGADYSACTPGNVLGANGSVVFGGGSATWEVENPSGAVSKTFANPLSLSSGGTFKLGANATLVFSTAPSSTGGTLTIAGTGTLQFTSASFTVLGSSINFMANGILSLPSGITVNGTTFSSTGVGITGTIATAGSYTTTISSNAPSFVGDVTGDFAYSGVSKTFGGRVTGSVKVAVNSSVTFSRTGAHTGFLAEVLPNSTAVVQGNFTAAGDGSTDVYYTSTLQFDGPTAKITTAQVSAWDLSTVKMTGATNCTGGLNMTLDNSGLNKGATTVVSDDLNTNVWSGDWVCGGDAATRSSIQVRAKTDGILTFSGTATSNNASHTRPFNLNGASGYAGTVRLTGGGFSTANAPVNLLSGNLHVNRVGAVALGSGLTVSNGATLACSSTGAYAAQMSGAVTLNSGAIMQFGAP